MYYVNYTTKRWIPETAEFQDGTIVRTPGRWEILHYAGAAHRNYPSAMAQLEKIVRETANVAHIEIRNDEPDDNFVYGCYPQMSKEG